MVEIGGFKRAIDVGDFVVGDSVGDFFIEAGGGTDDRYLGVGVEGMKDATCCDLET